MKKFILMSLLALSLSITTMNAQTKKPEEPFTVYMSGGISISNGNNFQNNAYPSLEVGIIEKNVTFGINVGRSSLNFEGSDYSSNYYLELRNTASADMGPIQIFTITGIGNYFNNPRFFIEYGLGLSYPISDHCSFTTSVSNWDGTTYLSPGLTYNFRW